MELIDDFDTLPRTAGDVVAWLLDDLTCTDNEANRQAARRSERIVETLDLARRHPEIYTPDADPGMAERAAVLDIAVRLRLSEDQVRALQRTTVFAMAHLPELWGQARDGFASPRAVETAATQLLRLSPPADAPADVLAAFDAAAARLDRLAADAVHTCPPEAFRRTVKRFVDAVAGPLESHRHTRAMADRKVACGQSCDGMTWIGALVRTSDAKAVMGRLTATAKHMQKHDRDSRTRDQIRADLFIDWLTGKNTATAVKTKIYVTIPIQLLAGDPVPVEQAHLVGGDTIDPLTAKQMFLDANAFHRVITDPVRGVMVDMDRRTYRPTRAQRDWLILTHGTCARDGCTRLAIDADIDHDRPWARGGTTSLHNLRPLCPRDHVHNHRTRTRYRTRPDGTVQITTPTGYTSSAPPPDVRDDDLPPF